METRPRRTEIESAPAPLLRGWLHLVCFFLALPAGALIVAAAGSGRARIGAIVYAIGIATLFGVSGSYHRGRWSEVGRSRMKRLDHAAIFVMIAATYTPLCLVALRGRTGSWLLTLVWLGALTGVVLAATGIAERRYIGLVSYISLGWVAGIALPEMARRLTPTELWLIVAGGLLYTVGGITLGSRWPNPWPRVFGYHEVWHVMTVVACALHFAAILSVIR